MEYTVRRLDPGSVFKIGFVLYGIAGLFASFIYELMFLIFSSFGAHALGPGMGNMFRIGSGVGAVLLFFLGIIFALFYALMGAAFTALGAVVYNLLASSVGGIKVTLKAEGVEQQTTITVSPAPQFVSPPQSPPTQLPSPYAPPQPPDPPRSPYAPPPPDPEEPPRQDAP